MSGGAPANCAFDVESLWVTDVGLTRPSTEASSESRIPRLDVRGGGTPTYRGRIAVRQRP